jgi:hypothetical protein
MTGPQYPSSPPVNPIGGAFLFQGSNIMGEAIEQARQQLLKAIEARIVEAMTAAIQKAKAEIAESVLSAVSDPFDAAEIEYQIGEEIGSFDGSAILAVKATA